MLHLLGTLSWISVLSISSSAARKRKQVRAVHMWKWLVHLVMSSEAYTIVAMNFWQVLQLRYGILIFLLQSNFWLTSSFHKIKHKIRKYKIPSLFLRAFPTCMSGFRWIVRSFPQNLLRTSYMYITQMLLCSWGFLEQSHFLWFYSSEKLPFVSIF